MGFSQALSGLNSAAAKLDVLGNNIANSQTVGFKGSGTQFADVYAGSVGLGTRVSAVLQNFSEGNLESTNRDLDLAVAGQGFYRFQQPTGEVLYSRNGQLSMNANGDLVNAQGAKVMGYGLADANDPFSELVVGGQPVALNVSPADMPARATGEGGGENAGVQAVYNLDASIDEGDNSLLNKAKIYADLAEKNAGDDPSEEYDYHYSNSFTVFDSLGISHNLTAYFQKTGDGEWTVRAAINGVDSGQDFNLEFDANGALVRDAAGDITGVDGGEAAVMTFAEALFGTGANDIDFEFNLVGTTQFSGGSTQSSLTQDGYAAGTMVGITIEEDGTVMRNYSNEQSVAAGQIALASFRNPEGLRPDGNNGWVATESSGQELLGTPGTGVLGTIQSGAVETSNVDMARELVEMIVTQRAYQANSQTIKTQDEVVQTAINLR